MIERYFHNNITWLDVCSPSHDEINEIIEECNIPIEFSGDLTVTTPKTEMLYKKECLKVTLAFPIVKTTDSNVPQEVKFIITKSHMVTIRFEEVDAIYRFGKEYEVICMLNGKLKTTTETLFVTLLNYFYEDLHAKLDYLESRLKDIEEEIFKGHEKEMVFDLSLVGRRIIVFRQTMASHNSILSDLSGAMKIAFNNEHARHSESLLSHYAAITRRVEALVSMHSYLRSTNDSLLTTKQNEVMKFLTVISFITFPLMLSTSMFGMNTTYTPILGRPYDFWIIISGMIVVSIAILIYFKLKHWI